ncbi:response regulator transcription factor [Sphingobium sp. TB-6]|uniref:response regulator transcription factor n=1 Tax=Sphingobium sp. TB-6 TaxID=2728850 RepID=UPI00146B5DBE|nr:response regulator transcription factor [Sphingobium sp. TB-6]NML91261.1 response regulator transcription factor [Sphingobium sp. TB-6]
MKILLVEDDLESSAYVARGLRELGHQVQCIPEGQQALGVIPAGGFDVLVLDRMLPGLDGLSLLRMVRAQGCQTPAMLLTAKSAIEDRVDGLEAGADDYLIKPFAFVELVARLNALGRRPPSCVTVTLLEAGGISMNLLRREVRRDHRVIDLQPREFNLLEQLLRNADRVVTRTMLLDRVWSFGFDPKTNIVETHMSRLRSKLNEGFPDDAIRTVRGSGYMIDSHAR